MSFNLWAIAQCLFAWWSLGSQASIPRWLIWGDSNSCLPRYSQAWPALLDRRIGKKAAIFNNSVPGRTTGFDCWRLNSGRTLPQVLRCYPRLDGFLVMLGTNDVKLRYGPPTAAVIGEQFRRIAAIVAGIQAGLKATIILPPPIAPDTGTDFQGAHLRLSPLYNQLRSVCSELGLGLIDPTPELDAVRHLEADGIHLNASGRRLVAQTVFSYLQPN